ncbi:uncharacterized protein BO88DRAFT_485954 [Aspergillus vadensis CBS 113365]|uniref:Uncharacterized protein n=1 Tax=Aspergillus vadensis (strain CBS 113365 / IMI 142717 / IBT 24658) TaxID=1448311 RepID=A0A319BFL5_ASPVC|nr:hypothetical protein BO88DRAFT_485954 [Aspergillus vadensis CBS 113365]PYH71437.1 hypothetical protein BO88DRAFT_485954 [Aspergillus vadensis CBS 113365]
MLSHLKNIFTRSTGPPSILLLIGNFGAMIHVLHLLPEDGTIQRFGLTTRSTPFRYRGSREQTREQIGTVTLHVGDGETPNSFLDDVETRFRKLRDKELQRSSIEVTQLVQDVLKPAALEAIHGRKDRECSMHATQTYPVYVVYILRPRSGRSMTELTSFP